MKLPKALENYVRECNVAWDDHRRATQEAAREQWEAHVRKHANTIIVREGLRARLIRNGAILPLANRPTLRLDDETRANPFQSWSVSAFLEALDWPLGAAEAEAA